MPSRKLPLAPRRCLPQDTAHCQHQCGMLARSLGCVAGALPSHHSHLSSSHASKPIRCKKRNKPAGHAEQVDGEVAPCSGENVPATRHSPLSAPMCHASEKPWLRGWRASLTSFTSVIIAWIQPHSLQKEEQTCWACRAGR